MRAMRTGVAISAALLLAACGSRQPEAQVETAAREAMPVQEAGAAASAVDSPGVRAARAMRDGRMYTPAGDTAIDHWRAARELDPDDGTTQPPIHNYPTTPLIPHEVISESERVGQPC